MKRIIYLISIAMFFSIGVNAEVKINGFATLAAGLTSDEDEFLFGYEDNLTFDQESLFAIQVTGDINDKTTATAQILSRGKNDYEPRFEWAYFTYNIDDKSQISGGRFRIPLFKYSASIDVGYSYHWIQPPQSIYGVNFNNIEGIRYDFSNFTENWEYQVQIVAGSYDQVDISPSTGDTVQTDIYDIFSASLEMQRDWFSFRTLYARGENNVIFPAFDPLLNTLSSFGFATLADLIKLERNEGTFLNAAIDIDVYDWFVGLEFAGTNTENSFLAKQSNYYATAGFRIGAFTPHITIERRETDTKTFSEEVNAIPLSVVVPFGPGGAPVPLRLFTAGFLQSFATEQERVTLGLRYDFRPNTAFKFDVTRQDDKISDSEVTLVRAALTYVF